MIVLTPDEIRVKEFLPSLRGYDADEVRAFLLAIADGMESREQQLAAAAAIAAAVAGPADRELASKVTRLSEELELAVWAMRRLEAAVARLEERLDSDGTSSSFLAS